MPRQGRYMQIDHTCDHPSKDADKKLIYVVLFNCYQIEQVSDNMTRLTIVSLSNPKGQLEVSKTSNFIVKWFLKIGWQGAKKKYLLALKKLKSDSGEYRKLKKMDQSLKDNADYLLQDAQLYSKFESSSNNTLSKNTNDSE